ncbi:EXS family-domain-containing protein [Endogone sp. FLAS-F59071]|nr:EXS family-domain-containing protein [Endogone sp. FLAS-F59071]|eukprot:RUS19600.1 EXS family-domain-containing protein [Endogone sp. FLAS-F59071]
MDPSNPTTTVPDDTLSTFRALLPFYYRPLIILTIGIWGWALNLHILITLGIDAPALLQVPLAERAGGVAFYRPVYVIAAVVSVVAGVNLWCFWAVFGGASGATGEEEVTRTWLPLFCYLTVVMMVMMPGNVFYKKERTRFLRSLSRILSLDLFSEVYFSDVILADILTSFAKVLGDLYTTVCALVVGRGSVEYLLDDDGNQCWRDLMVPLMTRWVEHLRDGVLGGEKGRGGVERGMEAGRRPAGLPRRTKRGTRQLAELGLIPSLLRFRQCISEYATGNYKNQRHLFNALKYASALPVIVLSAMQKSRGGRQQEHVVIEGGEDAWIGDVGLFRLWLFFVFINSIYSFYWDVVIDWNLIISPSYNPVPLDSPTSPRSKHTKSTQRSSALRFRTPLHFTEPSVYYLAVVIDFCLRTTWSLKLSSHLYIAQLEGSIFLMETLEVVRRWIWVFFRLESEWVRKGHVSIGGTRGEYEADNEYALDVEDGVHTFLAWFSV